jgi:GT2 family glycosyltransferase
MTSIVIPVRNRAALTKQCLDGLVAGPAEIVVVDDGSEDQTPELLRAYGDRIRIVVHDESRGFATACNDGASAASGEQLIFLNNDTTSRDRDWLEPLVRYAGRTPEAAVVGAKLLYENGTVQHAGIVICHDRVPRHVYRCFPADHPAVTRARSFRAVTAACMLVRRPAFEEAGGFDSAFENGFEDVDLCLRIGEAGHEVHYCPDSELVHLEAVTRAETGTDEAFRRNLEIYLERWAGVPPDDLTTYVDDGLIRITYTDVYPLQLWISPELAATPNEGADEAFGLLGLRSRQVFDLLKENALLRARLGDADYAHALERE